MNDFKDAYQTAVQNLDVPGMKEFNLDASLCMDEGKHQKRRMKQVHRAAATAFSAICVVFMFTIGTAETVDYIGNVIKENQRGFKAGTADAISENNRDMNQTYIVEEEIAGYPDLSKDTNNGTAGTEPETMAVDGLLSAMKESTAEPESAVDEGAAEPGSAVDEGTAEPESVMDEGAAEPGSAVDEGAAQPESVMDEGTAEPESAAAEGMAESAAAMDEGTAEPGSVMHKGKEAPGTASGRDGNTRSVSGNAAVTKTGKSSVSSNTGRQYKGR